MLLKPDERIFDAVLQIDLDATVLEDPRPFAASHAAITATGAVVAEEENAKRDFVGMRTHLAGPTSNLQPDFNVSVCDGFDVRPCFENSTRAIDSSKNQPNRLRCDRAREV